MVTFSQFQIWRPEEGGTGHKKSKVNWENKETSEGELETGLLKLETGFLFEEKTSLTGTKKPVRLSSPSSPLDPKSDF